MPIKLDVTSAADIAAAAARCSDVTVLINNAGIGRGSSFLAAGSADAARAELETNFFGPLALIIWGIVALVKRRKARKAAPAK